jgi:diguanylate cyclase (GGDEF)-like protein
MPSNSDRYKPTHSHSNDLRHLGAGEAAAGRGSRFMMLIGEWLAAQLRGHRRIVFGILAILLIVEIVTVAAIAISHQVRSEAALRAQMRQIMDGVVTETAKNAHGFLRPAQDAVLLARSLFEAGMLTAVHHVQLERFFLEQLRLMPQLDGLFFGDPRGNFLFTKRDQGRPAAFVTKVIEVNDGVRKTDRIWRDDNLRETGRAEDPEDTYDPRTRPWYKRATKAMTSIWTAPYIFFTSRRPGVTAATPVFDTSGDLLGVIGADVELGALSAFLAGQSVGPGGFAIVINRSGEVIAYPNIDVIAHRGTGDVLRLAYLGEIDNEVINAAEKSLQNYAMTGGLEGIHLDIDVDGSPYNALFKALPNEDTEGARWVIGVFAADKDFIGPMRSSLRESMAWTILISAIVTLVAFAAAWFFSGPLRSLQERATTDSLTGLLNRATLVESGTRALRQSKQLGTLLGAVMLDIDCFKAINDRFGHQTGDEVLVVVANRLRGALPENDMVARYGGEEFTVILPGTDPSSTVAVAERLRRTIGNTPVQTSSGPIPVTISLGVAASDPATTDLATLLDAADQALLRAKQTGRDRVQQAVSE